MKLFIVGCGQCGNRIADEFSRVSVKARVQRGIEIITGTVAVNTDVADLNGLIYIKRDYQHRVVIGGHRTSGHGVGKINELGAEVAKEDGDKVLDAIRSTQQLAETDAFLLVGSSAGGTGSGAMPILTQHIKEHYPDKAVYNLIVLPFKHEEMTEERTIYNAATCLKSTYLVADAIFLIDNQKYARKNQSLSGNIARINSMIVDPFYNLLCAGEEKRPEYIGSKILDAGDIMQTLSGWTVLGHGTSRIPRLKWLSNSRSDFEDKAGETHVGMKAMDEAMSELSLKCNPRDARRALYFLTAPAKELNMELMKECGTFVKRIAPEAIIRSGDYPRDKRNISISLVLSELVYVGKVMDYFSRVILYISAKGRRRNIQYEQANIEDAFRDIPSLL